MSQLELNEMHFISYGTCELKTCTGSFRVKFIYLVNKFEQYTYNS